MNLLLNGVTDPVKRSEAISSIVKSVSVVKEQVVRSTYITACSHRLGVNEAVFVSAMNKLIREDIEEQKKQDKRNGETNAEKKDTLLFPSEEQNVSKIEYMLIQMVVRHGQETLYKGVETADGGTVDLSVSQYISYDLGADDLRFKNDLYNRMLAEAVEHNDDEGFNAEAYLTHHPDIDISRTATEMAIDHFQLSKSLQVRCDEDTLRNQVEHLILDFRMAYVEQHLKELQREISLATGDTERMMKLMAEYKDMQVIRNEIAKELGNDILIK